MKKLLAAFAVLALLSSATAFADHPKAAEPTKVRLLLAQVRVEGRQVRHARGEEVRQGLRRPLLQAGRPTAREHPKSEHPK